MKDIQDRQMDCSGLARGGFRQLDPTRYTGEADKDIVLGF